MNIYLQLGTIIVIFALISYTIGVLSEQRSRRISKFVLSFITIGVTLDIIATTLMIIGSDKGGLTLHGFIGYSSLLGMLIDTVLIWATVHKNGINHMANNKLHQYTRYAYLWWVMAFITGSLLVFLK